MPIVPLPQFEADVEAARAEREAYERLKPPTSIVVRFGVTRMVGEFPYRGDAKPGCGSKIVVRTFRGVEVGEMLTSTCPNAGCSKSVTRKEMLEYIENSGGRDYPFYNQGRALRVATVEDMNRQSQLEGQRRDLVKSARARVAELGLPMKVVEAEPILGGERLTFYFTSEERIDFRELARVLAEDHKARIELRQVGARDEARLTADFERCGQHCCCRQFLKVLKPVSMKSAKIQKATLDPLKISGRCGRLMCCLRYEDETYDELRKRLPRRNSRVGTPEGAGTVVDAQILTQLVLVRLEKEDRAIAVAVEDLCDPDQIPVKAPEPDPLRGMTPEKAEERTDDSKRKRRRGRGRRGRSKEQQQDEHRKRSQAEGGAPGRGRSPQQPDSGPREQGGGTQAEGEGGGGGGGGRRKRRRRRRRRGDSGGDGSGDGGGGGGDSGGSPPQGGS